MGADNPGDWEIKFSSCETTSIKQLVIYSEIIITCQCLCKPCKWTTNGCDGSSQALSGCGLRDWVSSNILLRASNKNPAILFSDGWGSIPDASRLHERGIQVHGSGQEETAAEKIAVMLSCFKKSKEGTGA